MQIVYPKLDVSDHDSIRALVDEVKRNHGANVDILINNAGVNLDLDPKHGYGYENARRTLNVNYRGTKWVRTLTEALPIDSQTWAPFDVEPNY